jgi:hypothetical protein
MKNIVSILAIVLLSINLVQAQSVFSLHAVRVEGNIQNFEKVQKILSKGAQAAVNNGDISGWIFFQVVKIDGIDDENGFNYVFAQSADNIDQLLDPKFAWWNNSSIIFSKSEQDSLALLNTSFKWTKDELHTYVTEDDLPGGGAYVQFNFGRPVDISGFVLENKALWKPFFKDNMAKLNMGGWGVSRLLTPNSSSDAGRATIMTWDVFKSINDLMKFRIGFTIPKEMQDKSKMGQYMPDGFMFQPIYKVLGYTNAAK